MRSLLSCLALCLVSCSGPATSSISAVADLPLKSSALPPTDWESTPLRANSRYMLYNARGEKQKQDRLGDYYHVRWYDAAPASHTMLKMRYTQALTGSKILESQVDYRQPRKSSGNRKTEFFFSGKERARCGDIMTWSIGLYVDGKLVDSRHSYLWNEEGAANR